jgi:lysozyme family protein
MIGASADGAIGPNTLSKVREFVSAEGIDAAITDYQAARQKYYESLSTFETFGKGWTRRVDETSAEAQSMLKSPDW